MIKNIKNETLSSEELIEFNKLNKKNKKSENSILPISMENSNAVLSSKDLSANYGLSNLSELLSNDEFKLIKQKMT
jgi:hypothetical protein